MINTFKVYTLDGQSLGDYSIGEFKMLLDSDHLDKKRTIKVLELRVKNALLGDKGYGYCEGYFVAYRNVTIMTIDQQKTFTDRYFKAAYNRLNRYFRECKEWDEDVFSDCILYIYDKMVEKRGVNNIEKTFKFQYFMTLVGNGRKKVSDFISPDFDVADEDGINVSYIQQFASVSATLDDIEDSCIKQVNDLKRLDIIKDELYTNFSEKTVDMYLDYIEHFKDTRTKDSNGGVSGVAKKYGISKTTVKNKFKTIKDFINNKDTKKIVKERYESVLYPLLDDLTLKHIIEEGQ